MIIEFHHGALSDDYETQANRQGFTFGDDAEFVNKVGFGIVAAWIHGVITDSEYDKILQRFQKKILVSSKFLKKMQEDKEEINPYEKCKTCGQNRESCCGCPEVLELEQKKRTRG